MSNLGKAIRKIHVVSLHTGEASTIYSKKKGKKKQSTGLKDLGRAVNRVAKAVRRGADSYVTRHEKSNTKRRDGWLVDFDRNVLRADRSAYTGLRKAL